MLPPEEPEPLLLIAPEAEFTLIDLEDAPRKMTPRDHRAVVEAKELLDGPLDEAAVHRRWCEPAVASALLVGTGVFLTLIVWLSVVD